MFKISHFTNSTKLINSIHNYRLQEPIIKILYGAKNGLHAFGYNYAESKPIWMKSGTM